MKIGLTQASLENSADFTNSYTLAAISAWVKKTRPDTEVIYSSDVHELIECDEVWCTATSDAWNKVNRLGKIITSANKKFLVGGHHATALPQTLKYGSVFSGPIEGTTQISDLPLPDWSIYKESKQFMLMTSRGCPFKCNFCSSKSFWKGYHAKNAEQVIEEIQYLKGLGAENILIFDDLFTANVKRLTQVVEMIRANHLQDITYSCLVRSDMVNARTIELLKEMNVKHLAFGAESGSDRVLKMMNKNATVEDNQKAIDLLSSSGLKPTMSLIAGYPDESLEDIALTKQFIERNREKADIIEIYPCIPFPGTSVWDEFVKRNNFASLEEFDWSALSLSKDNIDWSSYHMLTDRYDKKDLIELLEWNEKEKLKDPRLSASQASAAAINHTSPVSTEKCPVCQFKRISFVSTYDNPFVQDERLSLCRCRECSTLFYSPLPSVNYTETFNEEHDKFYIEHDAGLLFMASLLYPLKDIKPKNMLDIGCGLGFAMDIGRDLFGIDEVLGFEPSYGKRLKVFDANIIDGYFPNDLPFENRKFDLILSSEVLEHTIDPKDFLQQIVTLLSENGTAILSTPNANAFFLEDKEQIGIAGPGQHTIIFSEESIYEVLGELDVSFKIFTSEGQSGKKHLIIYLTRSIIASGISYLKPTDPAVVDYLEGYLEKQYAKLQSKDVSSLSGGAKWLYFGVLARLVEIKVNKGNYPQCTGLINNMIEALKVQYQIDVHNMSSAMKVIRKHGELSFFEYMKVTPAFFSKFLFIYGIWLMNYQQEYKNACSQFAISAELAGIEIAFPFYNANQVIIDLANKHLELARSNANQVIIDLANKHLELARSKISSKFYNLLRDNLSLFIRKLRQFYCKR